MGAVSGSVTKTPVLLTLQLRPMTNLLASGIQTLTGQETSLRVSLRCSVKACIIRISLTIVTPIIDSIGNVKVDRLADLGKVFIVFEEFFLRPGFASFVGIL
jgi:hypothetical protein